MVKELRIVLDDSEYDILTTQKKAEGLTWKGVLYRAFGLELKRKRE